MHRTLAVRRIAILTVDVTCGYDGP